MPNVRRGLVALSIFSATASCVGTAQADTITISDAFLELYNISPNTLGFTPGDRIRVGSDSVVPNAGSTPTSPTTGVATTINTVTGKTVTKDLTFRGSDASPDFYSNSFPDNPALYGPWTLNYTNTTNTLNTASATAHALPAGIVPAPFVQSITISGSGGNPTFSWTPPAGVTVNAYKINIYDKNLSNAAGSPDAVFIHTYLPTVTSFTVPTALAGGLTLDPTHDYSIEIALEQSRNGATITNNSNRNVAALSRIFADFKPLPGSSTPQVNLPVTLANGSYQYNMAVTPGQIYYIDPTVATGYVYKTGAGDPNFASLLLPAVQSAAFDVSYQFNGSLDTVMLKGGGKPYTFQTPGGVSAFTVTGIDPKLGLDPADTTAFVTGLTFEGGGRFTGTQTPITSSVGATPLPEGLPLFAAGLIGLMAWFGWRNKWQSVAGIAAG
jgi:hypothetical protein